jgi:hypothetical protein
LYGLGEYPGYVCYDASRPSWLPNWLDTWTESTCKLKQAPGNIVACLNPLATNCAQDSLVNTNVASATPNLDPSVSGAGIVGTDQPNNTPTGIPTLNVNTTLWLAAGLAVLMIATRR